MTLNSVEAGQWRGAPISRLIVQAMSKYYRTAMVSGCLWAVLAYALAREAMVIGSIVWGGVIAGPLIGFAVAAIFRPVCRGSMWKRVIFSLVTLYIAVGMFGLAAGIYDIVRPMPHDVLRDPMSLIIQAVLGCWWGLTFTGLVVCLWPLSFANHNLICHFERAGRHQKRDEILSP